MKKLCIGLAAALALAGCGPFMVVRQGSRMFGEIGDRNTTLAKQRQALWAQLSPDLRSRCGPMPMRLAPLPAAQARVLLDNADESLAVPQDVASRLAVGSVQRGAGEADYVVRWQRETLHSEPALQLQELRLQVLDREGRVLRQDRQFAFDWQGALHTGYLRCNSVRIAGEAMPDMPSVPDFTFLYEAFGQRP